ncbi:YbgA family protein [Natronospira sp.]|uniref:YbgA family protein n=1 Tax=Natronospira sp. TaxID=2024970 RepID=UPI0038737717
MQTLDASAEQDGRIPVGISSCLLGEEVRYNGGHKRHRYVEQVLGRYFRYLPFCPEVAIGMGVPRPPIRLVGDPDAPQARQVNDPSRDFSDALRAYGREQAANLDGQISGYILKAKSPSCGMERVKVYDVKGMPTGQGRGLYAEALMARHPCLPVEEEGRLNDPNLRDNFIERVFVYDRWRRLQAEGLDAGSLVQFHTQHKFLILAHDQQAYRELGRLVAGAGKGDIQALAEQYLSQLMQALSKHASRRDHANVLMHLAGFFKKQLDGGDRQELEDSIQAYRRGEHPLLVPLTLLRHHLRRHPEAYVAGQHYLDPFPRELGSGER